MWRSAIPDCPNAEALYVHVPFCSSICAYCDFTRFGYHQRLADRWLKRIIADLGELPAAPLRTIYIGGGTPSALGKDELNALLEALDSRVKAVEEYTMEVNPEHVCPSLVEQLVRHGINRVSLGVQTVQPHLLARIFRHHDATMVRQAIDMLKDGGIGNISVDLMYGLPEQTMADWQADLSFALTLPITHLSFYSLTIEEHSQFGRTHVMPMDPDLEYEMYCIGIETVRRSGFQQYEISNFAKPGYESKHNLGYWNYDDFYGVGLGASGKEGTIRYEQTNNLMDYVTNTDQLHVIELSKADQMFESVMMGLRKNQGISLSKWEKRYGYSLLHVYEQAVAKQVKAGNLMIEDGYVRASEHGRMILHDVLLDFME